MLPGFNKWKTPTRPMGKVMTELAMSRGEPLVGSDIGMNGRLVPNVALKRLGRI